MFKYKIVLIFILTLFVVSCTSILDCNSVLEPTVNVLCHESGVYEEYNIETGKNEYKPKVYCFAYPSGFPVTYRVWSYNDKGEELSGGDTSAEGSVEVPINAAYVEVWPNLNGNFCKDKTTKVMRSEFKGINN